jgi:polyisoprenoid-binding protein YceI
MSLATLRLAFVAVVAALGSSLLGPRPYQLDPAQSEITFLTISRLDNANGSFGTFGADVAFDPDTVANSTVNITIDAASLQTGIDRRDHHLKTCDFFCVDSFPQIVFRSAKVTRVGPDRYRIDGTLTMRGVTHPLEIPGRLVMEDRAAPLFTGEFDLDRKDYGVNFSSAMNPIKDTVHVAFKFTLHPRAP